jgi:hypothetical protein
VDLVTLKVCKVFIVCQIRNKKFILEKITENIFMNSALKIKIKFKFFFL